MSSSLPSVHTVTYEFRRPERVSVVGGRVPRVARLLALAHGFDGLIRSGKIRGWGEAARLAGVTRARMTQIAKLLLLAPSIQEALLSLPPVAEGEDPCTERDLRPVVARTEWAEQHKAWAICCRVKPQGRAS